MKISVIIATYNRPLLLMQTIESLQKNTVSDLEMIVVNDASDNPDVDKCLEKVTGMVYYKFDRRVSIGEVKNKGISLLGKSDYIHFSDDDVYYTPEWDLRLIDILENFTEIGVVGGSAHSQHTIISKKILGNNEILIMNSQPGYSLFIRSKDLDKFTPFMTFNLEISGGEDSGFCERVLENNMKIAAINPPVIYHCGLKNFRGLPVAGYEDMLAVKALHPEILII